MESELLNLLEDDRRPIVTLLGSGGIGKTSLTLKVIEQLSALNRFEAITWFSARDIDLLASGPKPVAPRILSSDDIADQYAELVLSQSDLSNRNFDRKSHFQARLGDSTQEPWLFVFDNFETVQNPQEMFNWIDTYVRLPNKVLITTRLRTFKGDYPLEVQGMNHQEAKMLADQTASRLRINHILSSNDLEAIISTSQGHPYVIKILLAEAANTGRFNDARHVIARSDAILTALFERTFRALSPCVQRAFMTLSGWNSAVPRVGLEAVLMRSTEQLSEVERGVDALLHYSLAESYFAADDQQEFIHLPLAAHEFGSRQLRTHYLKAAIQLDVEILQMFTHSANPDVHFNLGKRLEGFIRNLSEKIDRGQSFDNYSSILDMVCRAYNPGWLLLARWHLERGADSDLQAAARELHNYIQAEQAGVDTADAWRMLGEVYHKEQNLMGQIHAYIERAQFSSVPFYDISNTARLLNRWYQELDMEHEGRRQLVQSLLDVMEERKAEANHADDLSRMAWLALHLNDEPKATEYALRGLGIDPDNQHCQRIASRMGVSHSLE